MLQERKKEWNNIWLLMGFQVEGGDDMTRKQAISFLKNKPAKFGHLLGFTDLSDIHNDWIKDMVFGKEDTTKQASRG